MATGLLLNLLCIAVNLIGQGLLNYWSALLLLGIGWNFMFVTGTSMLTETYTPAEKAKVQGFNDLLVLLRWQLFRCLPESSSIGAAGSRSISTAFLSWSSQE